MKKVKFQKAALAAIVLVLLTVTSQIWAQQAANDITGDWQLTVDINNIKMPAILSLSKDASGKLAGKWIGFGVSDLKDVNYAEGKLSFIQINQFRGTEFISNFAGTIRDDKLSGTLTGERGTSTVEGLRIKPAPAAVGNWEIKTKMGEKETTATLAVKTDKDGKLAAQWQDSNGTSQITDLKFIKDKLTFTRKSTIEGQEKVSNYELTVKGDMLAGTVKSKDGEGQAEGKLTSTALIGKWELTVTSERGTRMQILQVNRDLSGLYGAIPIDKINLQDNQVSFKFVMQMRDQAVENEFKGKLEGEKLTGDLAGGFGGGSRKVDGKKLGATPVSAVSATAADANKK